MDGYMAFSDGWTSQGGCRFCFEQSCGRLGESFYAIMVAGGLQSLGSSGADAEVLRRVGQAVSSRLLLSLPLSILMLSSRFPTSRSSRPCSTFSSHTEQFSRNVLPLPRWFCSISDGISFRSILTSSLGNQCRICQSRAFRSGVLEVLAWADWRGLVFRHRTFRVSPSKPTSASTSRKASSA